MRIGLILLICSLLMLQSKLDPEKNLTSVGINQKSCALDTSIMDNCTHKVAVVIKNQEFPWASNNDCKLNKYNVQGLIPAMHDSLIALALEHRLTNGLNFSKAKSNYHGTDYTKNGINYSAAIDISVRCLSEDQIRLLLDELALKGFAGWYRKNGEDGWKGQNHIHAIWVASSLKKQLVSQVKKWLVGKNGLTSDKDYKFWTPKPKALKKIRLVFNQSNLS